MNRDYKLSKYERWNLINQYKILNSMEKLSNENDDGSDELNVVESNGYDKKIAILKSGYEFLYGTLCELDDPIEDDTAEFVYKIISMYSDLVYSYTNLGGEEKNLDWEYLMFDGFNLENEKEENKFVRFLLEELDLFPELSLGGYIRYDSEDEKTNNYKEKLGRYNEVIGKKTEDIQMLSLDEIKYIVNA